ncbi:MAG TPA: hypothetical protein DHV95_03395 [Faecalibacterium sp.]|jgi:hypothetical protein|nr:hypothetical protein [Faecalibacterium sp.]
MVPPFFGFFRPLRFRMFQILFSGLALSVKSFGFASSPKGRALGKEMKFAWTAKGSHFEERLPPAGGRCHRR